MARLPHPGVVKCLVNPHHAHAAITVGTDGAARIWSSGHTLRR